MMNWGRKKSSIGHVFPLSWISRFKKMSDSTERNAASTRRKEGENSTSSRLPQRASLNEGQVHGGADDDLYWSLSFRKERCEGKKSGGVLKSVWYDDSDDGLEVRFIRLKSSRLRATKFEGREDSRNSKIQRRVLNDRKSRKIDQRILEENSPKDIFELEAAKIKDYQKSIASDLQKQHRSFAHSDLREIQGDCTMETLKLEQANALSEEEFFTSECLKLKNLKKNKCRGSWRRRNRKVRVYTPRTAGGIECKIRALEDLKKAKMKTKKATKERAAEGKTIFDSFAVVKSSSDPQEDFKHSMVEMIMAKGIKQPQELEELLACYLTLNDDEYHDLIIKVFRQVRFELNPIHFDPAIQSKRCCNGEHL